MFGKQSPEGKASRPIYEGLRDEITGGKLKPGDTLSRREIARRYGTSSIPVIEALGIPYYVLDSPDRFTMIPEALEHSRIAKRPVILGLQKSALRSAEREAAKLQEGVVHASN